MRNNISRKSYLLLTAAIILVGFFVMFVVPIRPALAGNGDIVIVVNNELGASLTGATVSATVACTGGAAFTAVDGGANDADSTVNGVIVFAAASIATLTTADCGNGEAFTVDTVQKDGYVTENTSLTNYSTAAQNDATTTLDFAYKLTSITTEGPGTDLTATATTVQVGDDTALNACTLSGGAWFCPVVLANSDGTMVARIYKDGYVQKDTYDLVTSTTGRTAGTDVQVSDTVASVQFAYKLTSITTEGPGTDLTATATTVQVGDDTALTACIFDTATWYCPTVLANSDGTMVARIYKDGYVQKDTYDLVTSTTGRTAGTDVQVSDTVASVQFAFKVTGVSTEISSALTTVTVTTGDAYGTSCTESSGAWYCAVPLANTGVVIKVVKDGYVTRTAISFDADRTGATDAQQTKAVTGVIFSYKITSVTSETLLTNLTATATTLEVGDATGRNACTLSGGSWYCPVVLANSDGTLISRVIQDGYVEKSTYALVTGTTRAAHTDAQLSDTIVGIQYGVKATIVISGSATAQTGATVTTGDSAAVTCSEGGSTGIYFCIVPLAHTDKTIHATKTGYNDTISTNLNDRTASTDAQEAVSFSMSATSSSGGSGGGGGGGSTVTYCSAVTYSDWSTSCFGNIQNRYAATRTPSGCTMTADQQALLEKTCSINNTIFPTEPTPASVLATDIVSVINQEKELVLGQTNPESYFINTGTATTLKLGSGERAAAVSSFKEAYGIVPKTESNWVDVLNIANGRWPITVNSAVEARAYINFKLVYGRNANMKNSTDVNALKMMGYGVRATKDRDLNIERSAIVRFRATFGFNPTTARHWNIMRAIAYSGVVK